MPSCYTVRRIKRHCHSKRCLHYGHETPLADACVYECKRSQVCNEHYKISCDLIIDVSVEVAPSIPKIQSLNPSRHAIPLLEKLSPIRLTSEFLACFLHTQLYRYLYTHIKMIIIILYFPQLKILSIIN